MTETTLTALTAQPGLRRWWFIQLIVQELLIVAGLIDVIVFNTKHLTLAGLSVLCGGFILTLLGFLLLSRNEERLSSINVFKRALYRINHYVQIVLNTITIPAFMSVIIAKLASRYPAYTGIVVSISFLILLVVFIPLAVFAYGRIGSLVGRILTLVAFTFDNVVVVPKFIISGIKGSTPSILKALANSGVFGAIIFVIVVGIAMHVWGFGLPHFGFSRNTQWWIIGLLALFCVLYVIFNAFSDATTFANVWTKYDFHIKKPTITMFLMGIEPGIAEEWLMRFAVLGLLLRSLQGSRHQFGWAVAISSLIFGLFHIPNMFAGQSVSATIEQMLFAASSGCLLAGLYLYTRAFWWSMLFHAGVDSLSFISSGTTTMAKPGMFDWIETVALAAIFIGITIFLLTGRRGRAVRDNFSEFSDSFLTFGNSLAGQTYPTR